MANIDIAELDEVREFLTANGETHSKWADWFEAHPDKEAKYVATGEWDNAEEHRRLEAGYKKAVAVIGRCQEMLNGQ